MLLERSKGLIMCDGGSSLSTKVSGKYAGCLFGNKTTRGLFLVGGRRGEREQLEGIRGSQDPSASCDRFALPIPAQVLEQTTTVPAHNQATRCQMTDCIRQRW